ncbi:MAG: sodium:proton antiporter [Burkholderiaceae bacterium]
MLEIAAVTLAVTAVLAYINHRFVGLPTTIGVMVAALVLSLMLLAVDALGLAHTRQYADDFLKSIDFSDVLMQGMLSLLLFAGALHVDLSELKSYRWQIGVLAVVGTSLSTLLVGGLMYLILGWVGPQVPLIYCLLFGALISPTDPIAVMGILKSAGAPKKLELMISGESLFNDGVGVVIFSLLLGVLISGQTPDAAHVAHALALEAGGGIVYGLVLGGIVFYLLQTIDQYQVEVLITLAAVMGGYALASRLHISGPLAMVVAGLMIGNHGRELAMSDTTRHHIDLFWELMDEILNAVLFVLIGLEVLVVHFDQSIAVAAVTAIVVTMVARATLVGLPVSLMPKLFRLPKGAGTVLTWGGLRGGISVALALSLPAGPEREVILTLTYCVVVFSILCQGLTIGAVARKVVTDD